MSDEIKFQPDEIESLGKISLKYQEKTLALGQLYLDKLTLDEKFKFLADTESRLKQEYLDIQKEEEQWLNNITAKYGEGTLNIKDGTFIPNKK